MPFNSEVYFNYITNIEIRKALFLKIISQIIYFEEYNHSSVTQPENKNHANIYHFCEPHLSRFGILFWRWQK